MDKRQLELSELSSYVQRIDKEVTMILQSLQWDRKHLIEVVTMTSCKYNSHHRVPPDKVELHEKECYLKNLGYSADDLLLPEPVDIHAGTLVTLSKDDVTNIIEYAAKIDPMFMKGRGLQDAPAPLTLGRLQEAYSADERRALHDAVVGAVPACHDLGELALPSNSSGPQQRAKSRAEVLAELRDMKRRRTKYRVPAKSRNYSDVLRDVISTQMEHYSEVGKDTAATANLTTNDKKSKDHGNNSKEVNNHNKFEEVHIKKEPVDDRNYSKVYESRARNNSKDKYKEREKRHDDYSKRDKHRDERDKYSSSSRDRSKDRKDSRNEKHRRDDSSDSRRKDDHKREYKDHSKSKKSDKHKRDREHASYEKSHKEDKYKRYYDFNDSSFESIRKRIKREKD